MARILIVDDTTANRNLLKVVLAKASQDYVISEADSGKAALGFIQNDRPDIILLDVIMPEMDGFEVCRTLKADVKYQSIPVLFITAMEKPQDKIKGFEMGAADYITKPFNADEVKARVNAHLKIIEAEKSRTEAENLKTVKDMIATYNHNMNQPLMTVFTYMEMLLMRFNEQDKTYQTLTKMKVQLDKINKILKAIQQIDTVKRMDYVEGSGMLDLGEITSGRGNEENTNR